MGLLILPGVCGLDKSYADPRLDAAGDSGGALSASIGLGALLLLGKSSIVDKV